MTTKIELLLTKNDDSSYQREILINGKTVFFQRFDRCFMDKEDFIHTFSKKVLNGLFDECSDPCDKVLHHSSKG